MKIDQTNIPGCVEIYPDILRDNRGAFVKTFHEGFFTDHGLTTRFAEEYYTCSHRGVLRGLHFQTPPMELVKMVTCVSGRVFDAVVDLRIGSPAYGKYLTFELSAEAGNMLYLPAGLAHGFQVASLEAVLLYKVTAVYSPAHDSGIRWDSAAIPWPEDDRIISKRDSLFSPLSEYKSPFRFNEEQA
jgi:dTDP-4-dehydrorhamnose 3,5-epimerase